MEENFPNEEQWLRKGFQILPVLVAQKHWMEIKDDIDLGEIIHEGKSSSSW